MLNYVIKIYMWKMSINITKLEAYGLWCWIENTCKLGYGFSKT